MVAVDRLERVARRAQIGGSTLVRTTHHAKDGLSSGIGEATE